MAGEARAGGETLPPQLWWRRAWRQAAYLAITLGVVALVALGLGVAAAGVQARRDEARSADLALVLVPPVPPEALADHVLELYRRGYVPRVVVVGEGHEGFRADLLERGVPEETVMANASAGVATLQALAQEARAGGATSLLLVAGPSETLTALKVLRDQGLRAYGSPPPDPPAGPLSLLRSSLRYWRYTLVGQ